MHQQLSKTATQTISQRHRRTARERRLDEELDPVFDLARLTPEAQRLVCDVAERPDFNPTKHEYTKAKILGITLSPTPEQIEFMRHQIFTMWAPATRERRKVIKDNAVAVTEVTKPAPTRSIRRDS